ncbi:hypothetical protein SCATT_33890 [Streptantibioticus cattleyicolor NRRL 8057 = DSM 46488]|uniref:Uncharacterized protein n=1 Tax=Streptantibioticus cattleyicolor (strain ATCC 35852 / DSM 46488 / JCM 4925 / NBRC 14057 / NRRL 8057) TaxID=1003195 RepID=G8WR01_STREN|nr:hypothetical protein SCATT_33890 [Streptantibioticus cattleyicolor NRRL 8057 = DSM 46488]
MPPDSRGVRLALALAWWPVRPFQGAGVPPAGPGWWGCPRIPAVPALALALPWWPGSPDSGARAHRFPPARWGVGVGFGLVRHGVGSPIAGAGSGARRG